MKKLLILTLMFSTLLSAIARKAWAIDPDHAEAYFPLIQALVKQDAASLAKLKEEMLKDVEANPYAKIAAVDVQGGTVFGFEDLKNAPEGSVGLVNFLWPIQKYDDWCGVGTKSRIEQMKAIQSAPNISALVTISDSPGGTVDGTKECADYIKNEFSKPVVDYIDGLSASAKMWISSAADERYASSETAQIGSIGTMVAFYDWRKYDENMGLKEHVVYATKSTRKNRDYHDALDGKYDGIRANLLDPLNELFLSAIQSNIPGVNKDVLTGEIYLAAKAKEMGLINGISTFEKAVQRAAELGNQSKSINLTLK